MPNHTTNQIERNIAEVNIIKDIRNPFRLTKKDKGVKEKVLSDIRTLFESDEEDCYKPIRTGNALSGNYIEYESNGDKGKTLTTEEYFDKIRTYENEKFN